MMKYGFVRVAAANPSLRVADCAYNAGQIAVACIIMENGAISLYLPPLVISGTVTGAVIGIISALLVKRLKTVIK